MRLLRKLRRIGRRVRDAQRRRRDRASATLTGPTSTWSRTCRFEQIEPRRLLTIVPIEVGAVYFEDSVGADEGGDVFEVTWMGGVPGTQLTRLSIDTDKLSDGLDAVDTFFDIGAGGIGTSGFAPLVILDQTGIGPIDISLDTSVADGGTLLVMNFNGFDPGERLLFSIDVDERGLYNDTALAEGGEFEGSFLSAKFAVDHFYDAGGLAIFWDNYDVDYPNDPIVTRLGLPPDSYIKSSANEEESRHVQTAGAYFSIEQEPLPISIAGTVYEDVNLDNILDSGEPGLPGVELALFAWEVDHYVATGRTTTTNTAGDYRFQNVLPGEYQVVETQPGGYFSIGVRAGTVNGVARGVASSSDVIGQITLLGGEESIDNDFAEAMAAELGGYVYHDADNDGFFDSGETGITGAEVRVQYLPPSGPAPSPIVVQSGSGGSWSAAGLFPGNYRVEEITPAGYLDGLDRAGTVDGTVRGTAHNPGDSVTGIRLLSRQSGVQYNFGELVPSSISGRVIGDTDADCLYGANDLLLEDVEIHLLDAEGNLLKKAWTDTLGEYSFTGLAPGTYGVEEIQPDDYFDGGDHVGSARGTLLLPDSIIDIPLVSATAATGYDFCELLPSSIGGRVIADADGNGAIDPGETPIAGVTVHLLDTRGTRIDTAVTGADGTYAFTGLAPGVYGVEEVQPGGYFDGADLVGSEGGQLVSPDTIRSIRLVSGTDAARYDFLELLPSGISGRVIADADGDGAIDPGETPIAKVTVYLLDAGGNRIETAVTGADGTYAFTGLAPGMYGVEEVQPGGYFDGADLVGSQGGQLVSPDTIRSIRLVSGTDAARYDFLELLPSGISGRVIADADGDEAIDPGEAPIAKVTVYLLDADGNRLETAVTGADGSYAFTGLAPGVYGVEETQPGGYFDGADLLGSEGGQLVPPDTISSIRLISGTDATYYDFLELLPSSIRGRVIADANGNCLYEPGEALLEGVTVYLLGASGNRLQSTMTDSSGRYAFTGLAPGEYGVEEIQPNGYFDGGDHVGSEGGLLLPPDSIGAIVLVSGTAATGYDFCELLPVSLSGYVYADDNDNGRRDSGEAGIAGVRLSLLDALGEAGGMTATTDSVGFYRFDGLRPNETYGVVETQPAGFFDGTDTPGNAGGVAQNPGDSIWGAFLATGTAGKNYNFGELRPASIGGRVHAERDGDCVPDPGEPLLAGVTIYLLDASGFRIDSTVTGADGRYLFAGLKPGAYGVAEIQPDGYYQWRTHVGSAGGELVAVDRVEQAQLGPGVEGTDYNFCESIPASISGYVFQDGPTIRYQQGNDAPDPAEVRDGKFTPDDAPIAGVTLTLGDGSGAPIETANGIPITTVTDENGFYAFTGLEHGVYTVLEMQPENFTDSIDTAGSNGGIAVNPKDELDPTLLSQLAVDPNDDAILRIPVGMGEEAVEYNFSEVRLEEFPPIIPPWNPPPDEPPPLPPPRMPTFAEPARRAMYVPAMDLPAAFPLWGGGGQLPMQSWHLSVINGGRPRSESGERATLVGRDVTIFDPRSWTGPALDQAQWTVEDGRGNQVFQFLFGLADGIPLTGDFDGDGSDEAAVFVDGVWLVDLNGNGIWDSEDLWAELGGPGDLPVIGDWDGDGKTDIGIFGAAWVGDIRAIQAEPGLPDAANRVAGGYKNLPPSESNAASGLRAMKRTADGPLRADVIDHVFQYGSADDVPVTGDFNGDGVTNIGLYRAGTWYLDLDGNGRWSSDDVYVENFGSAGDLPVVGDFDGDGVDQLGIYSNGTWRLDTNDNRKLDDGDEVRHLGTAGDKPIVGDFNGDGIDEIGVYRAQQAATQAETAVKSGEYSP